ncbi:MAG: EamA family transporter [Faecalibacillus sp.]
MLLMSALIWGSSFIVMKMPDFISPFTLLCIRFVLSIIFIFYFIFNKIKKNQKQDLLGGFLAGLALI